MKKFIFVLILFALASGQLYATLKPENRTIPVLQVLENKLELKAVPVSETALVLVSLRINDNCRIKIKLRMDNSPLLFDFVVDRLYELKIFKKQVKGNLYVYKTDLNNNL